MRQLLPLFRPNGECQHAKIVFCGIEVDADLQSLAEQEAAELIAVSHVAELARNVGEWDWGCIVVGEGAADGPAQETVARLALERPGFAWIVWSSKLDWPAAVGAMQRGALNVLSRQHDDSDLRTAVARAIQRGHERFLAWRQARDVRQRLEKLSESERQVLSLVMQGRTNKEIALQIDMSLRTVESRRQRILRAMQVENAITLAALLAQHGMMDQIVGQDDLQPAEPHSASA